MAAFSNKAVQVQRKGGKYEAVGFLTILGGIAVCFAYGPVGGVVIFVGFVIFLIGRFM